jgi:hypothetical protein
MVHFCHQFHLYLPISSGLVQLIIFEKKFKISPCSLLLKFLLST